MVNDTSQVIPAGHANSRILRGCAEAYLLQARRIWSHLPASLRRLPPGRMYGRHLHSLIRSQAERKQYFGTFFLRNRAELELMRRLLKKTAHGSNLNLSVLACSKGAEVYSIVWTIRSETPDLRLSVHAVDISGEILEFAKRGVYSLKSPGGLTSLNAESITEKADVTWNTCRDQSAPILERMTAEEINAMFDVEGNEAKIKSWLKEGLTWICGDAGDPELIHALDGQDMVVANRFLCHMEPTDAERCLRNIARLVKPGGYLFVSGIDLDVRTRVAQDLGWKPVIELIREVHEGDASLRRGWPLEYWGLEPFNDRRPDWRIRYASAFQVGDGI